MLKWKWAPLESRQQRWSSSGLSRRYRSRIRRLERRLEEFGAVNMRAIEQYDAVEQRLAEMKVTSRNSKSERSI